MDKQDVRTDTNDFNEQITNNDLSLSDNKNGDNENPHQEQDSLSDLFDSLDFLDFEIPQELINDIDSIDIGATNANPSLDNAQETAQAAEAAPTNIIADASIASKSDSESTTESITAQKFNQLESHLRAKVNSLSDGKRKLLGYSMIGVGAILSILLIVTTFAQVNFNSFFTQASSKDSFDSLFSKVHITSSQSKEPNSANSNSKDNQQELLPENDSRNISLEANTNTTIINNLSDPSSDSNSQAKLEEWQPISSLLASTPKRRKMAAKELGIDKGEWILACLSVSCGDCDKAALKLNELNSKNILAITTANVTETTLWKERLGLKFEVKAVSDQTFDDTGAVLLPTIIKLKDGISVAARENFNSTN
jgi:thiol-disulfide isomerase/thioredoxin